MKINLTIDVPTEYIDAYCRVNSLRLESKAHEFSAAIDGLRKRMEIEGRAFVTAFIDIDKGSR